MEYTVSAGARLPQEIYDTIIDEVHFTTDGAQKCHNLRNCSLVSSAFRDRSQSWILKDLSILIYPDSPFRKATNAWIHQLLETNPRIASYVNSLCVSLQIEVNAASPIVPPLINAAGFSGAVIFLPELRYLRIVATGAPYQLSFHDLPPDLSAQLLNVMGSPAVQRLEFEGVTPPVRSTTTLPQLKYLEFRSADCAEVCISFPRSNDQPSHVDGLDSLVSLDDDLIPESSFLSVNGTPLELCVTQVTAYAAYLANPTKSKLIQKVTDKISRSLRSLSVTINVDKFMPGLEESLNLEANTNIDWLEFQVLHDSRADHALFPSLHPSPWPFLRRILMTLPSDRLSTFTLIVPSGSGFTSQDFFQLDELLSDNSRFNRLRNVIVSIPSQWAAYTMPKLSEKRILHPSS